MNSILLSAGLYNDDGVLGSNEVVGFDTTKLQSHGEWGMYIDRIIFTIDQDVAEADSVYPIPIGPEIKVELRLGNYEITQNFIPIWYFSNPENPYALDGRLAARDYVWDLPRPLYVPPGMVLTPRIRYDFYMIKVPPVSPSIPWSNVKPRITYVGRNLLRRDSRPERVNMPWVSQFYGQRSFEIDEDILERSTESDLVNPFDGPLYVQRFAGRLSVDAIDPDVPDNVTTVDALEYTFDGIDSALSYVNVRMWDSLGNIVVRDPTPFYHLFHVKKYDWLVNSVLPPKGFYIVDLDEAYSNVVASEGGRRVMVAMIGHREVSL